MDSVLIITACVYFLPALVAWANGHNSTAAIFMLNLLLGWTGVFWLWALIWSLTGNTKARDRRLAALTRRN